MSISTLCRKLGDVTGVAATNALRPPIGDLLASFGPFPAALHATCLMNLKVKIGRKTELL